MAKHGFDLTDFEPNKFKEVLKENQLSPLKGRVYCKKSEDYQGRPLKLCQFIWKNKSVKLITSNNPLTGKSNRAYMYKDVKEDIQKGFAGYIGIEGKSESVKRLVKSIKNNSDGIKDESKGRRDFI